jgi:hypothetical protein
MNAITMNHGQRFNPYRLFVSAFIPNCLLRFPELSHLAKLLWARLAQYAGEDGACFPAQATLAAELATNDRQIRRALDELVQERFLEAVTRGRAGTHYYFLWHTCFDQAEMLSKHPKMPSIDSPGYPDSRPKKPDSSGRNPDILSAKENQEETQEEKNYHPHHSRLTQPLSDGEIFEISKDDANEYIALRTRYRVWQGLNGHLPKLLVPRAYAEKLHREYQRHALRIGDFQDLKTWAKIQEEAEEIRRIHEVEKARRETPEGQAQARRAAEDAERASIQGIKLKLMEWKKENPSRTWEELSKEVEEETPLFKTPHWYSLRFDWRIPADRNWLMIAFQELIDEETHIASSVRSVASSEVVST